ncbi:MAG: SDR family oxidoreductase [Candidatus Eremiobacteraeota bacterium]|nr:SDR family oxidoreductase [Candidatus Eremiobacteraeota bacterium]MCW5868454.1 SDR family oxidoreductase [Candidatus Eremiobacteraeota bacterium]
MQPLAVISGGTSGIGLAAARRLAGDHRLALLYARDSERAAMVEKELGAKAFRLDVGCDQSVEAGFAALRQHFAELPAVLINSAGIARFQRFFVQGQDLSQAQEMMNVNYFGSMRLIQQVLPGMYARRRGCIINLCSVSGQGGNAGVIGYAESKAALACLTRNLAMEVARRGISVNCVSPGRVATPMTEELLAQFAPETINYPLGRAILPEEVARVIEMLVRIGPAVNGQELVVDGGTSVARLQP